jgi:hypothetical protein
MVGRLGYTRVRWAREASKRRLRHGRRGAVVNRKTIHPRQGTHDVGRIKVLQDGGPVCIVQLPLQGHPQLAGYSIGHLFRNWVMLKHVNLVKAKAMGIHKDLDSTMREFSKYVSLQHNLF